MERNHNVRAWGVAEPRGTLVPMNFLVPPLKSTEVRIQVSHAGMCYSDVHLIDGDWGNASVYPQVCGHEIVGTIVARGTEVTRFELGQRVGVGWQQSACLSCEWCLGGDEQLCDAMTATCAGGRLGGFADYLCCDNSFVFALPDALPSPNAAPLLCAGQTVYTALMGNCRPGDAVGVLGIGGLGHLAIQFANKLGCRVTAISSSESKRHEVVGLGAHRFVSSGSDGQELRNASSTLDLLLVTTGAKQDWTRLVSLLRPKGTLCFAGMPAPIEVDIATLLSRRQAITTVSIGGRKDMSDMLRFAAQHKIVATAEILPMSEINQALEKLRHNQVKYRIVLENPV